MNLFLFPFLTMETFLYPFKIQQTKNSLSVGIHKKNPLSPISSSNGESLFEQHFKIFHFYGDAQNGSTQKRYFTLAKTFMTLTH